MSKGASVGITPHYDSLSLTKKDLPSIVRRSSTMHHLISDGLTPDRQGNLYGVVRAESRPGIYVDSAEGKELAYIKTEVPTNVDFGRG
jgi:hypothetical protein